MNKAAFIDRDGTINVDKEYVYKIADWELIPGAIGALKKLQKEGYLLIIITSQSGIGRGYYSEKDFEKLTDYMLKQFSEEGISIKKIYFCPHAPEDNCICRKPKTFLIKKAQKELYIDLKKSYVIGDKTADIKTGKDSGCKTVLVLTGKAGKDGKYDAKPDYVAKDLYNAANMILNIEHKKAKK